MNDTDPPGGSLYRGPAGKPRDKRERAQDRRAASGPATETAATTRNRQPFESRPGHRADDARPPHAVRRPGPAEPARPARNDPSAAPRNTAGMGPHASRPERPFAAQETVPPAHIEPTAPREQRIHGLNACLALFAKRPQALRKVWLLESRLQKLKPVLAHCAKQRLGYSLVEAEDLERLSGSAHHEGVVFGAMEAEELSLSGWLRDLPRGPALAIWLDGVGNPHNLGAILRSAAHFGVAGVLLPKHSPLALSGAAARVAEGGAEQVPMVRLGRPDNAIAQLASAGFGLAASVVRGGKSLYSTALPERLVLVMGAEQVGVTDEIGKAADLRLAIPGTGKVESLNVAAATATMLGEWWRQHRV